MSLIGPVDRSSGIDVLKEAVPPGAGQAGRLAGTVTSLIVTGAPSTVSMTVIPVRGALPLFRSDTLYVAFRPALTAAGPVFAGPRMKGSSLVMWTKAST